MLPLDSVGYCIVVFNANAIRRSYAADMYGMVMAAMVPIFHFSCLSLDSVPAIST